MSYGPFAPQLEAGERRARCRSMRALAMLLLGPRHEFVETMRKAEEDDMALAAAAELVERLPTIPRRKLLCSYAALCRQR